jgi:2-hydroxy-3-keto-5-methylthiopentenyl-1-phosphate phosphatase
MSGAAPFEVYFDFDHTITEFDVLDDIIQRFSINDEWKAVEEAWASGRIGSRECLERQFAQVRISAPALAAYLATVPIDPAFPPIVALLRARGIEPVIVSDSFTALITPILGHHGVAGIPTHCNELTLDGDRPRLGFPHFHAICSRSGNCKCSHLLKRERPAGTRKIYVGDGQSDICPANVCEILFAKGSLLRHYAPIRPDCVPFENLATVHDRLRDLLR